MRGLSAINPAFQENREGSERREDRLNLFLQARATLAAATSWWEWLVLRVFPLSLVVQQRQKPEGYLQPEHTQAGQAQASLRLGQRLAQAAYWLGAATEAGRIGQPQAA